MAHVLRSATNVTRKWCFECGASGHFKRDCPKLRNKNGGNRNAQGWVYVVGNAEKNGNAPKNPDSNVVTGTLLLNNRYASILFDISPDRSFISTAFSSLVNIDPTPLGSSYDVELADGKIVDRRLLVSIMSHTSSAVTYTSVYTNSEPGRVFWEADEEISDGGLPWVIVYGYDGLPMLPVAPPSPDYIPGPKEPQTPPAPQDKDEHEPMFIQPYDPDFIPEPIYPEYIPLEDEHILPAEEQPLPPVVSPTAESPEYVVESDSKEDPEEYEDDETEDGLVDYPMDGGDDGDDDDDNLSGYNADDEDEDEEEEEHLAPADSVVVISTDELVSPHKGTEPIIPPPSTNTATTRARITVRLQAAISFPPEAEVKRLLAMPTPSPSPLTLLSPPSVGERLARCTAPAALPSPPLPPSLYPPPPVDCRDDIPESEQPPHYGFVNTVEAEMRHQDIREVGYGIRNTWIDPAEAVSEMAPTTLKVVNTRVTKLTKLHEHDSQDLYALPEDAQDRRNRISQRVAMDSQREYQLQTHLQLQSALIQTHHQLHETHSQIQQTEMAGLRETDRRHQTQMAETLRVMGDMKREMGDMQAELLALRG
nr:hypothetical protein [Tanacetum cinerariifolium]